MTTDATGSSHSIGQLQAQPLQRSAAPDSAQRLAWQREMERAQGETWFKKPLPERPNQSRPSPLPNQPEPQPSQPPSNRGTASPMAVTSAERFRRDTPWLTAVTGGSGEPATRAAGATASPAPANLTPEDSVSGRDVLAGALHTLASVAGQAEIRTGLTEVDPKANRAADLSSSNSRELAEPPPTGRRDPIRWHVQWDGDRARIWFGLDAEHAEHAVQLASQVQRWLESQGVRVLSLVCNGKLVFDQPSPRPDESSAQPASSFMPTPSGQAPERFDSFFDLIATKET